MTDRSVAIQVVEQLRKGIPPERGVDLYSVGNEKLIEGVKKFHLSGIAERGLIRFVSGAWGAGKTHFFRLLREVAFEQKCLVSNVELNVSDAALNRFEKVFSAIVRHIRTPSHFVADSVHDVDPFRAVLRETLLYLGSGERDAADEVPYEVFGRASEQLMADHGIDIDFKKMVQKYWETFLPEQADRSVKEQVRGEILQWFSGEGTVGSHRKKFGVNKIPSKDTAKLMLQSLAGFIRLSGYKGLVILFDEAEQAYSIMRKSALRDAQNNLLSLINNIESLAGLFLIYATTPEFFTDPRHGIVTYGALSQRVGKPADRPPRAIDAIWNLDAVETTLEQYQTAARRIRDIYGNAYPEVEPQLPNAEDMDGFVGVLNQQHSKLAPIHFWRVLVAASVTRMDDVLEGEERAPEELYRDVMDRLREE